MISTIFIQLLTFLAIAMMICLFLVLVAILGGFAYIIIREIVKACVAKKDISKEASDHE